MHNRPANVCTKRNVGSATISQFPRMTRTHNWKAADEIFITCSSVMLTYFGEVVRWPSVCFRLECQQLQRIGKVMFVASWLKYPLRSLGVSHQKDVSVLSVRSERLVFVSVSLNVGWKTSCMFKISTICFPAKVTQHTVYGAVVFTHKYTHAKGLNHYSLLQPTRQMTA